MEALKVEQGKGETEHQIAGTRREYGGGGRWAYASGNFRGDKWRKNRKTRGKIRKEKIQWRGSLPSTREGIAHLEILVMHWGTFRNQKKTKSSSTVGGKSGAVHLAASVAAHQWMGRM